MPHLGRRPSAAGGALLLAVVLTAGIGGCTSGSAGSPRVSPTPTAAPDPCGVAVAGVVTAVRDVVSDYNLPVGPLAAPTTATAAPSGARPPASSPPSAGTPTAGSATAAPATSAAAGATAGTPAPSPLEAALSAAREAVQRDGCDRARFVEALGQGLRAVPARGAIAAAVLARLTATITGEVGPTPVTRSVSSAQELRAALARAPAGSTVRLATGELRLDDPLVILDAVTIEGAGAATTTLRTAAADAGVLVLSTGRVEMRGLTLARVPGTSGSGVLTGPSVALVLTSVTVSGGRPTGERSGGAGVHLSAQPGDQHLGRTTLEVTGSTFSDNAWAGIVVGGAHRVSIERSSFTGNGECGLCFLGAADGSVSASDFAGNGVALAAVGGSRPVAVDVTITGGVVGVQADDTAAPVLQRVRVSGTSRAAVIVAGRATGALDDVTCAKVPVGIGVGPQAAPTITRSPTCSIAGG